VPYVFELAYPGTWLDYPDRQWAWQVEGLLSQLESAVIDAALALALFEQASNRPLQSPRHWEADADRRREIDVGLARQRGLDCRSPESRKELRSEAELALRREKWRAGQLPSSYQHRLPFVHARSYLFAMDRLERLLAVLAGMPNAPDGVAVDAPKAIRTVMPQLRGVRNSSAHVEDRSRGFGPGGAPLDLKPVDNLLIHAPGGVIAIESLCNNRFGSTMADGYYGELEISAEALAGVCVVLQQVIDAFNWKGPPRHSPT
jgi:hypothetical protein